MVRMILLVAALLVLSGCGKQEYLSATAAKKEQTTEKQTTREQISVDVEGLYSEDGIAYDGDTEYEYSYHVPQIDDDRTGAAKINQKIKKVYGQAASQCLKQGEKKEVPEYISITYESFRSEDVLSLVIKSVYYYAGVEEYDVYNYDMVNGEQLDQDALLKKAQVTKEQCLEAVRCAAAKRYDDNYHDIWEEYGFDTLKGSYQELRSWTVSEKNISSDLRLFRNDAGVLNAILPVGAHAESRWTNEVLMLDFDEKDFIEKELADMKEKCNIKEEIKGLYSDYSAVFSGTIGSKKKSYLFLLTKEGRVEYVDVTRGRKIGYFCSSGPLTGVGDVESFVQSGTKTVYAVCEDGKKVNLTKLIEEDQKSISDSFIGDWSADITHKTASGGSYKDYVSLLIKGCDKVSLTSNTVDVGATLESVGAFRYLGMADDGVVFYYRLHDSGDSKNITHEGAVTLQGATTNEEIRICVKELSGTGILYTTPGKKTVLTATFG